MRELPEAHRAPGSRLFFQITVWPLAGCLPSLGFNFGGGGDSLVVKLYSKQQGLDSKPTLPDPKAHSGRVSQVAREGLSIQVAT